MRRDGPLLVHVDLATDALSLDPICENVRNTWPVQLGTFDFTVGNRVLSPIVRSRLLTLDVQ
jgi:hypothetical protein